MWGGLAPTWGIGPVGLLVRALGKYLDPEKKGSVWPSESGSWGTKISGDRPRGLSAQGVTSDLATCGPDALQQGILD